MKIIELRAENFKALKVVRIMPDGGMVTISGPNEAGKSAVLDVIWAALGGKDASPDAPIRRGEKSAEAELRLDSGLVVRRRWTASGTTLAVESTTAAGTVRHASPQAVLDALLAGATIDPMAWVASKPAEQVATLARLAGFDEAGHLMRRKAVYDDRTGVNRDWKGAEAALAALPPVPADAPEEEASPAEVAERMEAARRLERERAEAERLVERAEAERVRLVNGVASLEVQLVALQARIELGRAAVADAADASIDALRALETVPLAPSTEALAAELATIEAGNAAVRLRARHTEAAGKATALKAAADALTARLDAIDAERVAAIAAAPLPVPGLTWDENGVALDGIPLAQCSTSQRIRVGCAVAMARAPQLRILRVDRGESLDPARLEILGQWAEEHDCQVWIERVDASGGVGIYLEDGEVRSVDGVPVA